MEYDGSGYTGLANAVVIRACEDYEDWKMAAFRKPVRFNIHKKFYGTDAEAFLKSERLQLYTYISGEYIIQKMNEKILEKQQEILLHEMYAEFIRIQEIPTKKKGKKKNGK